jgi:hypothetical protein
MSNEPIKSKEVSVVSVWENLTKKGVVFWRVVTEANERFTCWDQALVAPFIVNRERRQAGNSFVYNIAPPKGTTVFFLEDEKGLVMKKAPEGADLAATPDPSATAENQTPPAATPPGGPKPYYGGYKQSGGSGRKPEDKRPAIVTMPMSYAKDVVITMLGSNEDLKSMDYDKALEWATQAIIDKANIFLVYALNALTTLGYDPKEAAK